MGWIDVNGFELQHLALITDLAMQISNYQNITFP